MNKKQARTKLTVDIDGKRYPCYQTMGALMILEQETGKSACRRERMDFNYTLEDFADNLTAEDIMAWTAALAADDSDETTSTGDTPKKV